MSRVLPILFNTEMVRAILDGRKTVTRRVIKNLDIEENNGMITLYEKDEDDAFYVSPIGEAKKEMLSYSSYQPGDILYVRETWTKLYYVDPDGYTHFDQEMYFYAADGVPDITLIDLDGFQKDDQRIRWHPSIHMPKEAARIWLKVKGVRVERLQDITNDQILKEGISKETVNHFMVQFPEVTEQWVRAAHFLPFSDLWNSTIKKDFDLYSWNVNPWVWVIEFDRCEQPEK